MEIKIDSKPWWEGYIKGASKTRAALGATSGAGWDNLQKQAATLASKEMPVFIPVVERVEK